MFGICSFGPESAIIKKRYNFHSLELKTVQINRPMLKIDAKTRIARSKPSALVMAMILIAIYLVLEMLIPGVLGLNNIPIDLPESITSYDAYMAAMDQAMEQIDAFFRSYRPSAIALVLTALLLLMHEMLRVGFQIYALHIARDEKADFGNLLDGFAMFGRVFVLLVLQWVIICVCALAFLLPGIVMSYRYRQALYLLVERPEYSPVQCLRESGKLMKGRKLELFVLDLSFLGWVLVQNLLPYIGTFLGVWITPYMAITYARYYTLLAGPRTTPDGKPFTDGEFTDLPDT